MVKNPPANTGDAGSAGSIPGSGGSPGVGDGNQYSCLENPMDRGASGMLQSMGSAMTERLNTHPHEMP